MIITFLYTITLSSSKENNERLINFLNGVKNLNPITPNAAGYVYKITSLENENMISYFVGTQHTLSTLPAWNILDFILPCDVVYQETYTSEEKDKNFSERIDLRIKDFAQKNGKTMKYLDNLSNEELEEMITKAYDVQNEKLSNFSKYCKRKEIPWVNFINPLLNQVIPLLNKIEVIGYKYFDIETANKAEELHNSLLCESALKILNEETEISINFRNRKWIEIEELIEDLKTKKVLISTGYGHLFGPSSLIDLLEKKNFKIEPVCAPEIKINTALFNEKQYHKEIQDIQNEILNLTKAAFYESKLQVKIHGLQNPNYEHFNEKFGIALTLIKGEDNRMKVLALGETKSIMVKKENLTFVQKIPASNKKKHLGASVNLQATGHRASATLGMKKDCCSSIFGGWSCCQKKTESQITRRISTSEFKNGNTDDNLSLKR
jgi:hypothetical protein